MANLEELQRKFEQACADVINIESQLEHGDQALKKGKEWEINARTALRHKKREVQRLERAIGEANREKRLKDSQHFGQLFISAAKNLLPPDQFEHIMSTARVMQSIAQS